MSESLSLIVESLQGLGEVRARRMFGGYGLFLDGLMFGLIAEDVLYFKVDNGNRAAFEAADLPPFMYQRQGRAIALSYYQAPAEVLEDCELALSWGAEALAAAVRSRKPPRRNKGAGQRHRQ